MHTAMIFLGVLLWCIDFAVCARGDLFKLSLSS
jgi:hypothetical protein